MVASELDLSVRSTSPLFINAPSIIQNERIIIITLSNNNKVIRQKDKQPTAVFFIHPQLISLRGYHLLFRAMIPLLQMHPWHQLPTHPIILLCPQSIRLASERYVKVCELLTHGVDKRRVIRYCIPLNGYIWDLDLFNGFQDQSPKRVLLSVLSVQSTTPMHPLREPRSDDQTSHLLFSDLGSHDSSSIIGPQ